MVAVSLAVVGCSKCGSKASVPDGAVTLTAPGSHRRSTDLRSAIMVMYPEYRATRVVRSHATLTRHLNGKVENLAQVLEGPAKAKGFAADAGEVGTFVATRADFVLEAKQSPGGIALTMRLPERSPTRTRL